MDLPNYRFLQELKALPVVQKIILFGSRARGNARARSDIDLAVALYPSEQTEKNWFTVHDVIENADTLLPIDCICLDASTPKKLRDTIQQEGVVLFQAP